jgi:hypothetical protein
MIIYETLEYKLNGGRKEDLKTIMSSVVKAGEAMIREAPGQ